MLRMVLGLIGWMGLGGIGAWPAGCPLPSAEAWPGQGLEARALGRLEELPPPGAHAPRERAWSPPERLTGNEREDTSPVALRSRQGTVWLFYHGGHPQDFNTTEIYYRTLARGRWGPEVQLTDNQTGDATPSVLEAQDGKLWLFWRTGRGSHYNSYEICYRTFDGRAWGPPQNLTRNEVGDFQPCALQSRDGTIWVFWCRGRGYDFSSYELYVRTFAGGRWSEERRLTHNEAMDFSPAAVQTRRGDLWLAWSSQAEGRSHLCLQRYRQGQWQPARTLTADLPGGHFNPTLLEDSRGRLWIAWDCSQDRLRSFAVYVCTSSDGVRWSPPEALTRSAWSRDATLLAGPRGEVWAFWSEGRGIQAEIHCSVLSAPSPKVRPTPPARTRGRHRGG